MFVSESKYNLKHQPAATVSAVRQSHIKSLTVIMTKCVPGDAYCSGKDLVLRQVFKCQSVR